MKFKNTPLTFKHGSKQGIHCISNLIENGEIDGEGMREKLVHKACFMFEIQITKAALPPGWLINIERKRDDFTNKNSILSKLLQIPGAKIKPLAELNAKDIYNIFLLSKKVYSNSQTYWSSKFPNTEIDWNICFKGNFVNPSMPRKCNDFNWKIFYGLVNTEVRLKRTKISTGCCCVCKNGDENLEHLYFCNGITLVWNEIEMIMRSVSNVEIKLDHVLVGYVQDEQNNFIINVLLSISRWEIWKRRNHIRYNDGDFL